MSAPKRHLKDQNRKATDTTRQTMELSLGEVSTVPKDMPWTITAKINDESVTFKVDTGADVTAIPTAIYDERTMGPVKKTFQRLYGPGRTPIHTPGEIEASISWNDASSRQRVFLVDGLQNPLLGRPAIRALGVLPHLHEVQSDTTVCGIEAQFPELFNTLGQMKAVYKIKLALDAKPYALACPRRVPLPLLPKVQEELQRMEKLGVITKVDSATEWCSPMVVVKKSDSTLRICVDYGELNKQILRERLIMPTVEENLAKIGGATVFSKLDANSGYWQAPLAPESQHLTTFITPLGRYKFTRLPFGISTAPEFFQREMLRILEGLDGQICHMDDILIFGNDEQDHDRRLNAVLRRLSQAGITLNRKKCELRKGSVKFLGHILSREGISPDPSKTKAIRDLPPPKDVSELRSFLGMANHLMRFLPELAEKTRPLRDLLHSKSSWVWGHQQQEAFEAVKHDLESPPTLAYYVPGSPTTLSVDASSYGLGAVLLQESDGRRRPIAYASRALSETEQKYAQVEKEALAIIWGIERFRMYVLGQRFHVETDHKPLVPLFMTKRIDEMPPRLQRLRLKVLEYDFSVGHVPGKSLFTADVLSRNPGRHDSAGMLEATIEEYEMLTVDLLPASPQMLDDIRQELAKDPLCAEVIRYCKTQWPAQGELPPGLQKYSTVASELSVVKGLLMRGTRLVIPPTLRENILEKLHVGHQGIVRCRARARESVWWPAISRQIQEYIDRCPICRAERKPGAEPILQTALPDRPWQVIGMDLFHERQRTYLIVVDYYSRFFEIEEMGRTTAQDVVLILKRIFARFGNPETVRSDNGPPFASQEFRSFVRQIGANHVTSSPHYPQSNGMTERSVQTAKALMKSPGLEDALLAHRSTPGAEGVSPAELLMGRRLRTEVPVTPKLLRPKWPDLRQYRKRHSQLQKDSAQHYNRRRRARERAPLEARTRVKIFCGMATQGTILGSATAPRSYDVATTSGVVRRTSRHLQAVPETGERSEAPTGELRTRSGRLVKPPDRFQCI